MSREEYDALLPKFKAKKDFAKELVAAAKSAGCKYISLTTRHHDGFSLYDTRGLSDYDVKLLVVQDDCFVLRGKKSDYLFVKGLEMIADEHLNIVKNAKKAVLLYYPEEIKGIEWIDNGEELNFAREGEKLRVRITDFPYGMHYCVRVARIKRK